jgi:23S rRNA (pseudouridine1915-N3)-methyltransferase
VRLRVIAIGRQARGPEAELFDRYAARLRPRPELVALADGRGDPAEIKRREAEAILARAGGDLLVALDQGGAMPDSEGFARHLARLRGAGRDIAFAIGGAEGLDRAVIARADLVLSLGALTFPHLLVRAMLAEQLYRAQSILDGHPYHRAGRP